MLQIFGKLQINKYQRFYLNKKLELVIQTTKKNK